MAPTLDELEKMVKHIKYEMCALELHALYIPSTLSIVPILRVLEGIQLPNTRVLRDFFLGPTRKYPDDLKAQDYFEDSSVWITARGHEHPIFETTRVPLDKQLAHLSSKRAKYSDEEFNWDLDGLCDEIQKLYIVFLTSLSGERKLWFTASLSLKT